MEIALEYALFIITGMVVFVGLAVLGIIVSVWMHSEPTENTNGLPPCKCKDVNKCTTWCIVKQRFHDNPPD